MEFNEKYIREIVEKVVGDVTVNGVLTTTCKQKGVFDTMSEALEAVTKAYKEFRSYTVAQREEMIKKINHYAKLVDMENFLTYNPENLSGGQKQRVAIAGVLAMETEVIIFDEATSMLDPKGTNEIIDMIKKLKQEYDKTIITITHNLEEAVFADRVIVLNGGRIVLDGKPEEVLKEKEILESCGLTLIDSLDLMYKIEKINSPKKKWLVEALWDLTFKM